MAESEREEKKTEQIKEVGSINLNENKDRHRIKLLTIIGEIEGHEAVEMCIRDRSTGNIWTGFPMII